MAVQTTISPIDQSPAATREIQTEQQVSQELTPSPPVMVELATSTADLAAPLESTPPVEDYADSSLLFLCWAHNCYAL